MRLCNPKKLVIYALQKKDIESKTKSHEVFDESGNAIPLEKNLPPPSAFSAQLLQGKFMQHPDGTIVKKRPSMYSASTLIPR